LDILYSKVIKPCRKGTFIYLICDNKKVKKLVKDGIKKFKIPFKRGLYTWKGIIVVASSIKDEHKSYFDKIYRVI
jgi:hypothetical protein